MFDEKSLNMSLKDTGFAALDIETSGLMFAKDRIVEIAVVTWQENHKVEEFSSLVNPNCSISKASGRIHGITKKMVKDSPDFKEIGKRIHTLLKGRVIIGHNLLALDISFLNKELFSAGVKPVFNPFIDTYLLSRRLFPGLKKRSLINMANFLGIQTQGSHRALPDARLVMKIWMKLYENFLKEGFITFKDLSDSGLIKNNLNQKGLEILKLAELYDRVKIVYHSPLKGKTERWIKPLGIRGGKIDSYCYLRYDFRSFVLKRIDEYSPP